jgi:C-terminal processing protease CtpA/Prc
MTARSLDQFRLDLEPRLRRTEGVIIDIRYNGGGYVAPFIIDVLLRRPTMRVAVRDRSETSAVNLAGSYILDRPTILLQNEQSLSNAEMCAEAYRRFGLGKVVGTATCGWVVWTWTKPLVDGTRLSLPRLAVRTLEGEDLEQVSRKPDVFVDRPLGEAREGRDSQLDAAVRELLRQIDHAQAR